MRVKICGITSFYDAINSINAGAYALGFVFYKDSPRYISPKKGGEGCVRDVIEKVLKLNNKWLDPFILEEPE